MRSSDQLTIVYIARGKSGGLTAANRFIDAYKYFDSGCAHKLCIIMKGWPKRLAEERIITQNLFENIDGEVIEMPDDGFDWGSYMRFAKNSQSKYLCFLNTNSRPLANNWLLFLYNNIQKLYQLSYV